MNLALEVDKKCGGLVMKILNKEAGTSLIGYPLCFFVKLIRSVVNSFIFVFQRGSYGLHRVSLIKFPPKIDKKHGRLDMNLSPKEEATALIGRPS